jgi:hypothetical protein
MRPRFVASDAVSETLITQEGDDGGQAVEEIFKILKGEKEIEHLDAAICLKRNLGPRIGRSSSCKIITHCNKMSQNILTNAHLRTFQSDG